MPDEKESLILRPGRGLARVGPLGGRIVAEMVSGALALSWSAKTSTELVPCFRIGEHIFCEPDYQQILLWAKAMELGPNEMIDLLLAAPNDYAQRQDSTQFANGRIIKLGWDISLLPLGDFEWVDGLVIESIVFLRPDELDRTEQVLPLPLPKLRYLDCSAIELKGIELSAVPALTELDCGYNPLTNLDLSTVTHLTRLSCPRSRLTKLDLFSVPQLEVLICHNNQLTELDFTAVPRLRSIVCMGNQIAELDVRSLEALEEIGYDRHKTRLIQRPDQNF
jgi:hypothetical protein